MTATHPLNPILIVDDEPLALRSLDITLRTTGVNNTLLCNDGREASAILAGQEVELALLDLLMPHVCGEDILEEIVRAHPLVPVIMTTGVDDVDVAVRCMKKGAFDYIVKPIDRRRLSMSVNRALEISRLRRENSQLSERFLAHSLEKPEAFVKIVTADKKMHSIFRYCEAVAGGAEPVLISGETGAGKELIAQALHRSSGRKGELVAVNVAGLDDHVFSDTLFGHRKGAFTGADQNRAGLMEKALGGTLFLDEIGDLSEASQVKLLRVIQEREYYPLGADAAKPTDARIIAATHADFHELLAAGRMRKDLYYRLGTHHIHLPPLRERLGDLPLLSEMFLDQAAKDFGKPKPVYPPGLTALLKTYSFPGNVRELRAMLFDAMSRSDSEVLALDSIQEHMRRERASSKASADAARGDSRSPEASLTALAALPTLKDATRALIEEALRRADQNLPQAAALLGISRQALSKRLKRGHGDD